MDKAEKILVVGDTLCFLDLQNQIHEYNVVNIGIGIPERTGNYQIGFWLQEKNEPEIFYPDFTILDLFRDGIMWKKGKERSALLLRRAL